MPRQLGGPRPPAREENEQFVRKEEYYCARCRSLRPVQQMVDDKALGFVCAEGCRKWQ